jgi:hypothetical protein
MLTILQQPSDISPVHNDLIFLVESTNYASAGFQFIAEIKDNGTVIGKVKAELLPGTDKGVFNVQRIIESYVTYDFDLSNSLTYFNPDGLFEYEVEFGETYSDTEYLDQTSVTNWAFNGAMNRKDFSTYASGEWVLHSGGTNTKFLTNQRRKQIREDQWDWLYFIEQPAGLSFFPAYATYKSYSADGTLLKTVTVTYATGATSGDYFLGKVPSGRNTSEIGSVLSGTLPVIDALAAYYTIAIYDDNDNRLTEEYRLDLVDGCSRYDSINVWYLNPMGGFDSFMFNMVNRINYDVQQKQMRRQRYELVGDTYLPNLQKHGLANYDTKETKRMTLNSDWINDQEADALHELVSSPVVFVQLDGETDYTPVTLTTRSWEKKNENTDGLFNAQIEILFDMERRQGA